MQMGVTGCTTCYFFVWTQHGFLCKNVPFDAAYWDDLKNLFREFYNHYLQSVYQQKLSQPTATKSE